MNNGAKTKRAYEYKMSNFEVAWFSLLSLAFGFLGLYIAVFILRSLATATIALDLLFPLGMATTLISVAFLLLYLPYRNYRSSKYVIWCKDKVQRPMTKGDSEDDYLLFDASLSLEIDQDYRERGPALIVRTQAETVVFERRHFDSRQEFSDFCDRAMKDRG